MTKFMSILAAAAAFAVPAIADENVVTRIILTDRPLQDVLISKAGHQMMTLEEFHELHPQFADLDTNDIIPAGTSIIQPVS
jgi:hypothetical protein